MSVILFHLLFIYLVSIIANISAHSGKLTSKFNHRDYFDNSVCLQEASCIPLHNATCFGTSLPYLSTSLALAEDSFSQFEIQDNLALWQGLRSVPRCWAVVQPLLCAVYMPKCENGSIFLPSQEMCRITREPCRSVEAIRGWPPFLQCENKTLFPPRCRNPLQEVKFNTSYKCVPPLVETDDPNNWYDEVKGCGLQCQNPFYSKEEHDKIHSLTCILAFVCCIVTTFTVLTFMINWRAANRYPDIIIFCINLCLAFVAVGWLIQFVPGVRDKIVCSHDGTIRRKQPRYGEHYCIITFILTYFFLISSMVWFVLLAWYVSFKQSGTPEKKSYFHICAWSLPLILTTIIMAMTEVDGDSMSGICFVGYANMYMRSVFLLVPIGVAALTGGFFITCFVYTLIKLKLNSGNGGKRMILKIGFFSAFAVIFIISAFASHAYDFLNRKEWDESLKDYIVCLAMNSVDRYPNMEELSKCELKSKPGIGVIRLQLFCLFGYGIIMSLWVFNAKTFKIWKCFLKRRFRASENNPPAVKKHNGMDLDITSIASRTSASWALAYPHLLDGRNAIRAPMPVCIPQHYSSASDMSQQISLDSFNQPSIQMSEQEMASALRHQRRKTRKEREATFVKANRLTRWISGNRRGSDTSLQSSLATASATAAVKKAGIIPKVTKSTSTGDLNNFSQPPGPTMFPPVIIPHVNSRPQIQRQAITHPFTHGMTDNSHLNSRISSVTSTALPANPVQICTPNQYPIMPNSFVGMVHPSVYGRSYNVINSAHSGYFNNDMYQSMNTFYPNTGFGQGYIYNPYFHYASCASSNSQFQHHILPMHPIADSSSEASFLPIIMSDSEYTDTGIRSYDESRLLSAQLMMQEHIANQMAVHEATQTTAAAEIVTVAQNSSQQKLQGNSEACALAKTTQLVKKIWPFKANITPAETLRPPSGQQSAHSEAPPPSPIESSNSLNENDLDDVFINPHEPKESEKNVSIVSPTISLASTNANTDTMFCKLKTKFTKAKFRRAISYINNLEKIDTIEVTSIVRHSSLLQLSRANASVKNQLIQKEVLKDKLLHASECISLMNGDASFEHNQNN